MLNMSSDIPLDIFWRFSFFFNRGKINKAYKLLLCNMSENKPDVYREGPEMPLPEIEGLREKLQEKQIELKDESAETKEKAIRKEIEEKLKGIQPLQQPNVPLSDRDEADEIAKLSAEKQVEALVSLVFEKGLEPAVSVAKKINNPAILDGLHDILVDKYYEMLITQGVIKA